MAERRVELHCATSGDYEHALKAGDAFAKYLERNEVYQDAWAEAGLEGNINMLDHKLMRVKQLSKFNNPALNSQIEDDLIDLVNYAVFALRILDRS